jgi:hypothetical protein
VEWREWLDAVNWGAIGTVVGTAAVVATAVSTGMTLWLQMRWRPEPDWAITGRAEPAGQRSSDPTLAYVMGRMINAGDGPAFRVHASGADCTVTVYGERVPNELGSRSWGSFTPTLDFVPVMHPGEEYEMRAEVTHDDWNKAKIIIEWTPTPNRLRKRKRTKIPVAQIAARPSDVLEGRETTYRTPSSPPRKGSYTPEGRERYRREILRALTATKPLR